MEHLYQDWGRKGENIALTSLSKMHFYTGAILLDLLKFLRPGHSLIYLIKYMWDSSKGLYKYTTVTIEWGCHEIPATKKKANSRLIS